MESGERGQYGAPGADGPGAAGGPRGAGGDGGTDLTGRLLGGRYRVTGQVGRGGMGVVCRAVDEVLGREVAVKVLRAYTDASAPELADLRTRMQREARAAARIKHPGVVTVHDVVDEGGRPVIVMELIDGSSLDDVIAERGAMDPREIARVGARVMDALDAAHQVGVLHRDVKPGNVLLERRGRVVLTDFGIASIEAPDDGAATNITRSGELVGSLDYLPPERAQGQAPGPASDIWSLGMTLYAAVEGSGAPFRRTSVWSTLTAIVSEPLPAPRRAGPLTPVLHALMAKDPTARPTAAQARAMLEAVAEGRDPMSSGAAHGSPTAPDLLRTAPPAPSSAQPPSPVPQPAPPATDFGPSAGGGPSAGTGSPQYGTGAGAVGGQAGAGPQPGGGVYGTGPQPGGGSYATSPQPEAGQVGAGSQPEAGQYGAGQQSGGGQFGVGQQFNGASYGTGSQPVSGQLGAESQTHARQFGAGSQADAAQVGAGQQAAAAPYGTGPQSVGGPGPGGNGRDGAGLSGQETVAVLEPGRGGAAGASGRKRRRAALAAGAVALVLTAAGGVTYGLVGGGSGGGGADGVREQAQPAGQPAGTGGQDRSPDAAGKDGAKKDKEKGKGEGKGEAEAGGGAEGKGKEEKAGREDKGDGKGKGSASPSPSKSSGPASGGAGKDPKPGGAGGGDNGGTSAGSGNGGTGSQNPAPPPSCSPIGGGKHNCQVWRTAASYTAAGQQVGTLNAGTNYFYCQANLGRRETHGEWTNVWWAKTDDDSGNTGVYVSVVYLKGGANDQPVPGLPTC